MSSSTTSTTFALNPGVIYLWILNLPRNETLGQTKKLGDERFDSSLNNLRMLLDRLETHAEVLEWKSLCKINGKTLFGKYNMIITIEKCKDNTKKFIKLDTRGKVETSHDAHLSQQLLVCIKQSITIRCAMRKPCWQHCWYMEQITWQLDVRSCLLLPYTTTNYRPVH